MQGVRRLFVLLALTQASATAADSPTLAISLQSRSPSGQAITLEQRWNAKHTAIIVCDYWDSHHCANAVRRVNEMAPALNRVLQAARENGVIVIHAPSDCMDAYREHPARRRAMAAPAAAYVPPDVKLWCSVIPTEASAAYPIDQSDGGEDDDPAVHARWEQKLIADGRNPQTPWQRQHPALEIDEARDFLSDRGEEIWNVLESQSVRHVILAGVHANMCVLGRPFGLRQLVRNGKQVVLMRDMTDAMYNPRRWPYVSHNEGTRRVIAHIERYVCPTMTSDQLVGGTPFRFSSQWDTPPPSLPDIPAHWRSVRVPDIHAAPSTTDRWYRAVVQIPRAWESPELRIPGPAALQVYSNGQRLAGNEWGRFAFPPGSIHADDWNLIVVHVPGSASQGLTVAPELRSGTHRLSLEGTWQLRLGQDPANANMPLPAKFGGTSEMAFAPQDPLWTPRAMTAPEAFTAGIEGPACGPTGHVFAVNFGAQGTIGRVSPEGRGELFTELPKGSIGNGIRFAPGNDRFFVADYTGHNILQVACDSREVTVYAHNDKWQQPNDLAIAPDGTLYVSDPHWQEGTGSVWRVDSDGKSTPLLQGMGTTNGIEVSPDGNTLYVNESQQRTVWAFDLTEERTLKHRRRLHHFSDFGLDGMRCDVDGNLYVTRYGKGTVVKLTPDGELVREIPVLGSRPSNLCFGGPDGRTVYVTEVDAQRLVRFRVDRPGRGWTKDRETPPNLRSVRRIWDAAPHNAFTDLVRWRGAFYCAFREGQRHAGDEGHLRILRSDNGRNWASAGKLSMPGYDLRDAALSVTPGGKLLVLGGMQRTREGVRRTGTFASFSEDGQIYSEPAEVVPEGRWLWRVTWQGDTAYGVSYGTNDARETSALLKTNDGRQFDVVAPLLLNPGGWPTEARIRFTADGTAICLHRRDGSDGNTAFLGTAPPPYKTWNWHDLGVRLGGPNFLRIPDGRWIAAGRSYNGGARTVLYALAPFDGVLTPMLELPSSGDTSYPGMVWHDDALWVSYYSSHEGRTSIYIAEVEFQ